MREVPVHYLRANHAEWSPSAVIVLDTETATEHREHADVERLRLWVAHYTDRRVKAGVRARESWGEGDTAAELAAWVDDVTRNRDTVWLYAHNLGFDLSTTRLPLHLVALGWTITDAAVGGKAPWLRMAKGRRHLCLTDSWSWLPTALGTVGDAVAVRKPPLPEQAADRDTWAARCRADVVILETALLDLMTWWDAKKLGRWNISGAASGWNAYRHVPTPERVTIDPDPDKVKADRAAVHGGRRGTWVIGEHRAGPFLELDLAAAYPTVAAELPLPKARTRPFDTLPLDTPLVGGHRWGVVAEVELETDVPRWPVKLAGRNWYPVGRFTTTLAGPEIAEARELGCLRRIGPGWVHQLGYAMRPWAQWVLRVQGGLEPGTPAVARIVAKHWGRAVLGKWCARGFHRTELGPSPVIGWGYEEGWNHSAGLPGGVVDLAGQRWWVTETETGENSYPAVFAWVESYVRVRLSRAIEAVGPASMIQCDTDGMIVAARTLGTRAAHGALVAPAGLSRAARCQWTVDALQPLTAPLTMRVKRTADHVQVIGPQHLWVDGVPRLAGVSSSAGLTGPGQATVKQWPSLSWQLRHGDPAGYVRPEVTTAVVGPYPTGWVLTDGRVVPVEARMRPDGTTTLVGWETSSHRLGGAVRGPRQHAELEGYW